MARYINPYTDFGFKKLFGEEGSKEQLKDFLNELLPPIHKIKDLSFKQSELLGNVENARKAIFDIYCEAENGTKFIVEMQKAEIANFNQRERDQYDSSLKIYRDLKGVIDTSFHDGVEKGITIGVEKGKQEEKERSIRKAISRGKLTIEEIAEDFGVSVEFVKHLPKGVD